MGNKYMPDTAHTQEFELLEEVIGLVFEFTALMSKDDCVTLQVMCGKEFWTPLSKGQVRTLGQDFSDLVHTEILPIEHAKKNSSNAWLYRLR